MLVVFHVFLSMDIGENTTLTRICMRLIPPITEILAGPWLLVNTIHDLFIFIDSRVQTSDFNSIVDP